MKHPFVIASIIAVLTAATHQPIQAQTASPVSGSPEANKALIRSFYDKVLNASDPSAVDSLVSTDYQYGSGIPTGLAAYKQYLAAFQKAVPNYTTYIQDMIAEGDWVAVRSFDTGTQQDVLNKVPATGKDFSVQTADLYRIANGQLIAHIGIFDNLGVFEQLGVVKAPQLSVIPPVQATTATLSATDSATLSATTTNVPQVTLDANKTLVKAVETALYSGDNATVDKLVNVNYVYHGLGGQGSAGLEKSFADFRAAFADFHIDVLNVVAERDMVVIYTTFTGTQQAPFLGIPSTGKAIKTYTIDFYRIQNGQISDHWDVVDYFAVLQQLGLIPSGQ